MPVSKLTSFCAGVIIAFVLCAGRKLLGFSELIEIDLVLTLGIEVDLVFVCGPKIVPSSGGND